MIDDKYQDLINRALDKMLSPEEQAELDSYLEASPEARRHYDSLRQVTGILSQIPSVKAPADFKASVMESVQRQADEQKGLESPGILTRIADTFRRRKVWRYAYVFCAGVLCGIVVLAVAVHFPESSSRIDNAHVSGTMGLISQSATLIETRAITINELRGTVEVRRGDGTVIIEGEVPSLNETTIELTYDSTDLVPATVWQPEPYTGVVSADKNAVILHLTGSGRFAVVFRDRSPAASTIFCRILSAGEEETLDLQTGPIPG